MSTLAAPVESALEAAPLSFLSALSAPSLSLLTTALLFVPSCSMRPPVRIHQHGDPFLAAEPDDLPARQRIDLDCLVGKSLVVQDAPDLDAVRRERELIEDLLGHVSQPSSGGATDDGGGPVVHADSKRER